MVDLMALILLEDSSFPSAPSQTEIWCLPLIVTGLFLSILLSLYLSLSFEEHFRGYKMLKLAGHSRLKVTMVHVVIHTVQVSLG